MFYTGNIAALHITLTFNHRHKPTRTRTRSLPPRALPPNLLKSPPKRKQKRTRLAASAEADAIRTRAQADADVLDDFARQIALQRLDVQRVSAFGNRTVFAPIGPAEQMGNALAVGFASSVGASRSKA